MTIVINCDCNCHDSPLIKKGCYCLWCKPGHDFVQIQVPTEGGKSSS